MEIVVFNDERGGGIHGRGPTSVDALSPWSLPGVQDDGQS
jgi:hypothetical protein